ncbi:MAG: SIS domain-containing protein [Phycisphaerales bacterium JB040]
MTERDTIQSELDTAARVLDALRAQPVIAETIAGEAARIAESVRAGGKVLAIGNGGSCADAMHFCEELTGRYRDDRPPIPALACADPGHITCTANDYGYEAVFERWVIALARPGDTLIALTTSGNSENILRGVRAAKAAGARTITFLGKGGGRARGQGDAELIVPGETADRIQELHMLLLHTLVGAIERELA